MKSKKLIAWQKATNEIAQEFCNKYFDKTKDWRWTCEVGGILEVNGYYFRLDRIVDALKINCLPELLIQFYEYEMDCYYDESLPRYNFKTWVKYYAGFNNGQK